MSTRAWIAFGSVSVLWGIPYLFIKVAVDDGMPPAFLARTPSAEALGAVVVLGIFCTALAFVMHISLLMEVGPGRAAVITYVAPVVAVGLGVAVLGERPGAGAVAGLLLILAGSWLSTDGRLPPGLGAAITRVRERGRRSGQPSPPAVELAQFPASS